MDDRAVLIPAQKADDSARAELWEEVLQSCAERVEVFRGMLRAEITRPQLLLAVDPRIAKGMDVCAAFAAVLVCGDLGSAECGGDSSTAQDQIKVQQIQASQRLLRFWLMDLGDLGPSCVRRRQQGRTRSALRFWLMDLW